MRYARHTRLAPASKEFGNGKTNSRMAFQNLWEREDAPELKPNRGNGCYGVQGVSIFSRLGHFNIENLFLTKCSGGAAHAARPADISRLNPVSPALSGRGAFHATRVRSYFNSKTL